MTTVVLDTSVVVGWLDGRDAQHERASELMAVLTGAAFASRARLLFLDCVLVETIGVLCRRRDERKGAAPLPNLAATFPEGGISRAHALLDRSWNDVMAEVQDSDGRLNTHDALILRYARSEGVDLVATFDTDLKGRGVTCLGNAGEAEAAFPSTGR